MSGNTVASFGLHDVAVGDMEELVRKILLAIKLKLYEVSVNASGYVKIFTPKALFGHLKKFDIKKIQSIRIEAKLQEKWVRLLLHFAPPLDPGFWLAIYLATDEWITAPRKDKEGFNRCLKQLVAVLKPKRRYWNADRRELEGRINEDGFIL